MTDTTKGNKKEQTDGSIGKTFLLILGLCKIAFAEKNTILSNITSTEIFTEEMLFLGPKMNQLVP